jgi:23S rRNA-/tRNA-specific pseudouridylate synthase
LDNDTQGFLYFAKDLPTYDKYKQLQAQNKVEKHYIAQVQGRFCPPFVKEGLQSSVAGDPKGGGFLIDYPIMHRSLEKMIAIKDAKDVKKGR